ncbi:hypothetical protein D0Z07_4757 [Hyphodiscus hymeniophilus]|uniref:Uncharacterized protein n=1 Tax=Hyphodiscus hymeniophilus TaxID=353542 RepID=A0A9P7AXC9_9HELO|nr:hypothetical protein D0Z07_4757 [Hyphodiscus hymeniophilus]
MIVASVLFAKAFTLGDYEDAEKLLVDCSKGLSRLSDRHPWVLTSDSTLALALFAHGRTVILGHGHPDIFLSMTWKGEILETYFYRQSAFFRSEELTLIFGPEHRSTPQCKVNFAAAKLERETTAHYEFAQSLYNDHLLAALRNPGDLHPETLKSKANWARSMILRGPKRHEEAKQLWMEACAGFAKVLGLDGIATVPAYREYEDFFSENKKP